jgi:hypothetical protein
MHESCCWIICSCGAPMNVRVWDSDSEVEEEEKEEDMDEASA